MYRLKPIEESALTSDSILAMHPLLAGTSILPTPQIAELCATVRRALLTRQLGLCFTAKSGMGKTIALEYLATYLSVIFPSLAVYNHTARNHKGGSVRGFFKHFLATVGHPLQRGETADLRDRLCKAIVDAARCSSMPLVLMLIDEAQAMDIEDFTFLKDVSNEVGAEGVSMITVLMAQEPDFSKVWNQLVVRGRMDLISRFTLQSRRYRSLETADDLRAVLGKIDETPYSESVPQTWLQVLTPKAFSSGFRLEVHADEMYRTLAQPLASRGLASELPLRQVFHALRILLLELNVLDSAALTLDHRLWAQCANEASIEEAALLSSASAGREWTVSG